MAIKLTPEDIEDLKKMLREWRKIRDLPPSPSPPVPGPMPGSKLKRRN